MAANAGHAQATQASPAQTQPVSIQTAAQNQNDSPAKNASLAGPTRNSDRRRAAKLYLSSSKLFADGQFEAALSGYQQAAKLDPGNPDYPLAASVARSHAVTALIQVAAKDRLSGDEAQARAALAHALEFEPGNPQVKQHLYELGDDALLGQPRPIYEKGEEKAGEAVQNWSQLQESTAFTCTRTSGRSSSRSSRPTGLMSLWTTAFALFRTGWIWITRDSSRRRASLEW